jgi:glutathione S-transferase
MTIVEHPGSPLVSRLRGVHLFGFDGAPCSQRVSFALAEKGLRLWRTVRWDDARTSTLEPPPGSYLFRRVSLPAKMHLTEAYAAMHSKLVVPALVHEGRLHIESTDIVDHIDACWPEPPLIPADPAAARLNRELIDLGRKLHVSVRYVSFHWGLGNLGKIGAGHETLLRRLERPGSPERLLTFYTLHNRDAIDEAEFIAHLRALEEGWGAQERRLRTDGRPFLTGATFAGADIVWSLKLLRMLECGYPFRTAFPALAARFDRIRARPGFRNGVWRPNFATHHLVRAKAAMERWLGSGIRRATASASGTVPSRGTQ